MLTVADVKCYHCGHISGEIVAEEGQSLKTGSFRPAPDSRVVQDNGRLRCSRCSGPVYLDEIRRIRPPEVFVNVRPRRGRPRRSETLAKAS